MRLLVRSATRLQGASAATPLFHRGQVVHHSVPFVHRKRSPGCTIRCLITMATAQEVQAALQELLPALDPNTATERKIREQIAGKLGDISEHKKLIKGAIDEYLTAQLKSSQPAAAAAAAAANPKRQRGLSPDTDDDEEAPSKPSKQPKSSNVNKTSSGGGNFEGAPEGGIMLDTQGLKWASVSSYKGQQYINIRNYYRVKDTGALGPTKKGISLTPTLWAALQAALPQLQQAVQDESEDCSISLSDKIKASINTYQGKLQVDIREYYGDDGDLKPGLKGISLLPPQFESLVDAVPELNKQLGSSKTPAAAAAAEGGGAGAATASASKPVAATAAGAGAGKGSSGGGGPVVELGGKKRAAISDFGGGGVDLRETYEKDGQLLPGKKGILLKPAQWSAVCAASEDISDALQSKNMGYRLDLGNKRSVQLSEFRNQHYVAIREYYEKDGKLLPGQKGCNLTGDQWYKLVNGMAQLNEHLK